MNLSSTYILIFLKILIANGDDKDEKKCERNISNTGVIEYLCPPSPNGSKTSIHVYSSLLTIECNNTEVLDDTILPTANHKSITKLKLTKCPLPENGFKDIVNRFNITNLKQLSFSLAKTPNYTLKEEELMGLAELERLELFESNIFSINGTIFRNTPNLSVLMLNRNSIKLNENLFDNLPNLIDVSMYRNNISYIPKNTFSKLSKLSILELWSNNIQRLESGVFSGLSNLKRLELSLNKIEIIEGDALKNLINLVDISLKGNNLQQISRDIFSNCKNIETINMKSNPNVTLIDDVFSDFASLREVNLAHNQLKNISETLFEGSRNLRVIHLDNNRLKYLEMNVFQGLENLEELYLDRNEIEMIHSHSFFTLKELKKLYLQHNFITRIGENLFKNLQNLKEINLSYNKILYVHPNSFINNKNLMKFSMTNNDFDFGTELEKHNLFFKAEFSFHLKDVDLRNNKISYYPEVLSEISTLESINLKNNSIKSIQMMSLLPNKSSDIDLYINLDLNNISTIEIHPEHLNTSRKSKTFVTITGNPIICDCNALNLARFLQEDHILKEYISFEPVNVQCSEIVNGNTRMLNNMELADLTCALEKNYTKNGDCDCLYRSVDDSLIVDCSKRELTEVPELYPNRLSEFKQTEVHLEGNRLKRSPEESDGYANITKLFLQENEITNVTWIPASLKVLNLSDNALSFMNDESLKLLNESRVGHLYLGSNPWRCDCGASSFADYLRGHIKQIDSSDIRCESTNKKLVDLNRKDLCPTKIELILILSLSVLTLFFLVTITTSVYFKYKKEILIWLYSRGLCLCLVKEDEIDEDKIYDAFISYSHKDEEFVTDNIISELESGEQPYKLCVHVRDFIPGELIHSQILKSVRSSRRTIVILSSSFLESVWGKLEFKTAHTEAMIEGRARVIIIIYGDIDLKSLDDDLKAYIKTNTYVEWGDPWFWKKLRYALPKRNRKTVIHSQKHANMMQFINDKFHFVKQDSNTNPISTPPIILDPSKIEEKYFTCIA